MTYNKSNATDWMQISASHCISWLAVFGIECLAAVILNIITIIVFVKQRQLQSRSTYLIIHLGVVDLLVGAIVGPMIIEMYGSGLCHLWESRSYFDWLPPLQIYVGHGVYQISLNNLAVIALERVHATFRPFKHRFIRKWVYGVMISVNWVIPLAMYSIAFYFGVHPFLIRFIYLCSLLSVILVCYVSIYIKIRCSRHLQHNGAASLRERKLTTTLFIATLASLLTFMPRLVYWGDINFSDLVLSLSRQSFFDVVMATMTILILNSIINPIIYIIRMSQLRGSTSKLIFRRAPNHLNPNGVSPQIANCLS